MRLVVATVHLVGLGPRDAPAWADEKDPQIKRWLNGGQLLDVTPKGAEPPPTPGAFLDAPAAEARPGPAQSPPAKRQRRAAPKK